MKLLTEIPLQEASNNLIDYNSNILLLGSCFVENIGDKLSYFKFRTLQNPIGILFHPKAIETLITNVVSEKKYSDSDVFFHNEQWHCFAAHSKFSNASKEKLLQNLNKQIEDTSKQIKDATHVIITLGTAWVYRFLENNKIVANCHKVKQKQFGKELLSIETVAKSLETIVNLIQQVNPNATIIFTVSPIRHIKDGFIENTQSKAHLIAAIHKEIRKSEALHYFPSYEIMMDELRDYRFYSEDMIHPNKIAVNYIWEKFKYVWVSNQVLDILDQVDVIQKGLKHKPFNPNSEAHIKFLSDLDDKIKTLQSKFLNIEF